MKKCCTPSEHHLFVPVLTLLAVLLIVVLYKTNTMITFMGWFFIAVAFLKLLDWNGFVTAFSKYDLLGKNKTYGRMYPLIELTLGILYLVGWNVKVVALVTFIIMVIGAIGVAGVVFGSKKLSCACLGTAIKIPLTKFTLVEDVAMVVMSLMIMFGL